MAFSTTGSIIPEVSETYALTLSLVSYLPLCQFGGGFAGLAFLAFLVSRGRAKPAALLSAATLAMSASSLSIAALRGFSPAMLAAFFVLGGAMSFIFGCTGALVSRASGGDAARNLNVLYAFMSGGVVLSPLLHGALVSVGAGYNAVFCMMGGMSLGLCAFTLLVRFPSLDLGGGSSPAGSTPRTVRYRMLVVAILAMGFCYMAAEAIPANWIPKYLNDAFDGASGTAGTGAAASRGFPGFRPRLVLSLFWASVTAGRRVCAALLERWNRPLGLLVILAALASALLVIVPNVKNRAAAEALFAVSGLFFSGIIPVIFSFTGRLPGGFASVLLILVLAVGMLGATLMNRSVGFLSGAVSFRAALAAGALPLVVLLGLAPLMKRALSRLGGG
jgi:fucose permease